MRVHESALTILDKLNKGGFEAYVVGGCVRDSLLGREPKDWDICTNARPEEVMKVFKEFTIIPTGLQHGTVTIMLGDEGFEVTTYRIDGEYTDGRHPDSVEFTSSLREDLSRRDFTVNAMAYNPKEGIIDFFGGKEDLEKGLIKCVGNPEDRFSEDALRILRALRFASVLGYEIEEKTSQGVNKQAVELGKVSRERINVELIKILCGKGVGKILREYKYVIAEILPEIEETFEFDLRNKNFKYDLWEHTVRVVENCSSEIHTLRLAALLHDIGKAYSFQDSKEIRFFRGYTKKGLEIAEDLLRGLKFSNTEIEEVIELIRYSHLKVESNKVYIRNMLNKLGERRFRMYLELKEADLLGQGYNSEEIRLKTIGRTQELLNTMDLSNECYTLKHLKINGKDLIELGYTPGKDLGLSLNTLLKLVMGGLIENKPEVLKEKALELLK